MGRHRHPDKDIEAAMAYAESRGWVYVRKGGHAWGILRCSFRGRDGHQFPVWSTPRNPAAHAKDLRREVDKCPHATGGDS